MTEAPTAPNQASTPPLPALADVPRDSALEAEKLGDYLLTSIQAWAPGALAALDYDSAEYLRRTVNPIAFTLARRNLSKRAALDAHQAARIIERTAGQMILRGQELGTVRKPKGSTKEGKANPADLVGPDVERCYVLGRVTDEEFSAAIEKARDAGTCNYADVAASLAIEGLSAVQEAQRETIRKMAADARPSSAIAATLELTTGRVLELAKRYGIEIPADAPDAPQLDVMAIVAGTVTEVEHLGGPVSKLVARDFDTMDAATAKDAARRLWAALVPLMAMQRGLRDRGREA